MAHGPRRVCTLIFEVVRCIVTRWKALWDGEVFVKGSVKVEAELKAVELKDLEELRLGVEKFYLLAWSVTRI